MNEVRPHAPGYPLLAATCIAAFWDAVIFTVLAAGDAQHHGPATLILSERAIGAFFTLLFLVCVTALFSAKVRAVIRW